MTNSELWSAANAVVHEHGLRAANFAMIRADQLLNSGDVYGAAKWRGIFRRVHDLLSVEQPRLH